MNGITRVRRFGTSYQTIFPPPAEPTWKANEEGVIEDLEAYYEAHKNDFPRRNFFLKLDIYSGNNSAGRKIMDAVKGKYAVVDQK